MDAIYKKKETVHVFKDFAVILLFIVACFVDVEIDADLQSLQFSKIHIGIPFLQFFSP